jgi:hypothetical protein
MRTKPWNAAAIAAASTRPAAPSAARSFARAAPNGVQARTWRSFPDVYDRQTKK